MPAELKEKCGIFGVYGPNFDAPRLAFFGLFALQHRGQEGSGITASDGKLSITYKEKGLVSHIYSEEVLRGLKGDSAIGHNRYATSGGSIERHIQPVVSSSSDLSLVHNGNLHDTSDLEQFLMDKRINVDGLNDSEMMHAAIEYYYKKGSSLKDAVTESFPLFKGAFSVLLLTNKEMAAFRDRFGIRPISLGKLNGGYVVASETCALDIVNATYERDVNPGEMVIINQNGISSYQIEIGNLKLDLFEYIYFARPDSILLGKSVFDARYRMGRQLAIEHPIDADVVVPVPDSAVPAAAGFSHYTGIPYWPIIIKNRYIHRTFIQPEQHQRQFEADLKFNPIYQLFEGKRVVVIDDSIVRGTTTRNMLRDIYTKGHARSVSMRVQSPPFKYRAIYGIDAQNPRDLLAAYKSIEEIRQFIGADDLGYLSLDGVYESIGIDRSNFTDHEFTGIYPTLEHTGISD